MLMPAAIAEIPRRRSARRSLPANHYFFRADPDSRRTRRIHRALYLAMLFSAPPMDPV
jgi:hypothetical protein